MDPNVGFGIEHRKRLGKPQRPRPSLRVRGLELAGLGLATYGLGSYRFALGGLMIVGSYALYRRRHGPGGHGPDAERGGGDGPDSDGESD